MYLLNCFLYYNSDDDIAIVKSSLHLFKVICISKKHKDYMNLVIFAIRVVLVAFSQLFGNKSILENEKEDAKHKATKLLKQLLNEIATKMCELSSFIVNSKSKRQTEMQVGNVLFWNATYIQYFFQHWTQIFVIECDDNIKEYWYSVCSEVIISRLIDIKKVCSNCVKY